MNYLFSNLIITMFFNVCYKMDFTQHNDFSPLVYTGTAKDKTSSKWLELCRINWLPFCLVSHHWSFRPGCTCQRLWASAGWVLRVIETHKPLYHGKVAVQERGRDLAWENSRRFARSPLEPSQNDVWKTTSKTQNDAKQRVQKFHTDDVPLPRSR